MLSVLGERWTNPRLYLAPHTVAFPTARPEQSNQIIADDDYNDDDDHYSSSSLTSVDDVQIVSLSCSLQVTPELLRAPIKKIAALATAKIGTLPKGNHWECMLQHAGREGGRWKDAWKGTSRLNKDTLMRFRKDCEAFVGAQVRKDYQLVLVACT